MICLPAQPCVPGSSLGGDGAARRPERSPRQAAQAAAVAHWPLACTQPANSPEKKRKPCVGTCENTRPIPSHARQPPPRRAARAPDLRTMRRRPALPARPRPVAPHLPPARHTRRRPAPERWPARPPAKRRRSPGEGRSQKLLAAFASSASVRKRPGWGL